MKWLLIAVLACGFLAVRTQPARADLVFYGNRASFDAATTGVTTIGFEGIAPVNGFTFFGQPGSLTLSGVTFSTGINILNVTSATYYLATGGPPGYNLGSGDFLLSGAAAPASLHATLPGAFTALAFDLGTFDDATSQVTIKLSTGDTFTTSAPFPTDKFIGLTSTVPFTSVDISITGGNRRDTLAIDNFAFGAAEIPEPGTLSLLSLSLVGMAVTWKRTKGTFKDGRRLARPTS
jgi:hypothetical protein